jgi:hypothetical protein
MDGHVMGGYINFLNIGCFATHDRFRPKDSLDSACESGHAQTGF